MTTKLERTEYLHFANERYATSSGFGLSMYYLFKPSIIDVTALEEAEQETMREESH